MITLILALLALIPDGGMTMYSTPVGELVASDIYGNTRSMQGGTWCDAGYAVIFLEDGAGLNVVAHELVHAVDCTDDGALNGSPATRPTVRPTWASDYCWDSPVEWAACLAEWEGGHAK